MLPVLDHNTYHRPLLFGCAILRVVEHWLSVQRGMGPDLKLPVIVALSIHGHDWSYYIRGIQSSVVRENQIYGFNTSMKIPITSVI